MASPTYLQSVNKLEEPKDLGKMKVIVVEPFTTWDLYCNSQLSEGINYKGREYTLLI